MEDENKPVTKQDIFNRREEVIDKALISAVKTLTQLQRDQSLIAYSKHPKIMKTFQDKYQISISFSLHVGRAIEGAIGSEFKVDALYLSADTQIALRIDKLCDTYDRQVLLSGDFYRMVSERGKSFCRKIDQVCMTETKGQMREVYSFDIFPSEPLEDEQKLKDEVPNGKFIPHMDFEDQNLDFIKQQGIGYIYELDHDFVCIKRQQRPEFLDFYEKAVNNYLDGDWVNAQSNISSALVLNPIDGPLRWMNDFLE